MVLTPRSRKLVEAALRDLSDAEESLNKAFRLDVAKTLGISAKTLKQISQKLERVRARLEKLEAGERD
ncbi:MAG: hypothetical protein QXW42_04275 [Thermofilum sp.]